MKITSLGPLQKLCLSRRSPSPNLHSLKASSLTAVPMSSAEAAALKAYATGFAHLLDDKYYILASSVVNLYDILLTYDDEIKYIWSARVSLATCCFYVFRYIPPVVSIVNFFADHDPRFAGSVCQNWIWLPVANAPIVSASTGGELPALIPTI